MHCLANFVQGMLAPTRTRYFPTFSITFEILEVATTTPDNPPSRTSKLLPLPSHNIGKFESSVFKNIDKSSTLCGIKNCSAGPPTRREVCLLIGSLNLRSPLN